MTQKNIQPIPVVRSSAHGYELAALVGDEAVILGWTMDDSIDRSDLLGFAIRRTCRNSASGRDSDCRWLSNHRRFAPSGEAPCDELVSTQSDPLQQFYFLDYAVKNGLSCSYSVLPVRGTPTLRYYESPISVTVYPQDPWSAAGEQDDCRTEPVNDDGGRRNMLVPGPGSQQSFGCLAPGELAAEVQRLTEQARSAVFLYSTVPLPASVTDVVREVNSGRLLYGLTPGRDNELIDVRRAHNTVHLSRPVEGQRLEPLRVLAGTSAGSFAYTSALVTDPWSRNPRILLWTDVPRASSTSVVDTRLIVRDKRCAARLATHIFQAYATGRLPVRQSRGHDENLPRRLEPDGRWSNIYFSRHAQSHKFREREIFSGHP